MIDIKCLGICDTRKGIQSIQKISSDDEMRFHRKSLEFRTRTNNNALIFTVLIPGTVYKEISDMIHEDPKMAHTILSKYPTYSDR